MNNYKNKIQAKHQKKFDNLYMDKQKEEGVKENPNESWVSDLLKTKRYPRFCKICLGSN